MALDIDPQISQTYQGGDHRNGERRRLLAQSVAARARRGIVVRAVGTGLAGIVVGVAGAEALDDSQPADKYAVEILQQEGPWRQQGVVILREGAEVRDAPSEVSGLSKVIDTVGKGEARVLEEPIRYTNPNSGAQWYLTVNDKGDRRWVNRSEQVHEVKTGDAPVLIEQTPFGPNEDPFTTPGLSARLDEHGPAHDPTDSSNRVAYDYVIPATDIPRVLADAPR